MVLVLTLSGSLITDYPCASWSTYILAQLQKKQAIKYALERKSLTILIDRQKLMTNIITIAEANSK